MCNNKENLAIYDTIFREYGKVKVILREILEKKQMTRYKLADLSGTSYEIITKYYHNKVKRPDLDVLARICFVLGCEISDILKYEKPAALGEHVDKTE